MKEPTERTTLRSLEQNDPGATNGPEIGSRATGSAPDRTSQVSDRLTALAELSIADLRLEWRRLFRADPPRLSRDIMTRAVAYRLQEIAYGGASKVTQRRLMTLAAEFETRGTIAPPSAPKIKPGSRLVREWHGRTHTVCVTGDGFASARSQRRGAARETGRRRAGSSDRDPHRRERRTHDPDSRGAFPSRRRLKDCLKADLEQQRNGRVIRPAI